jgi:uridine kinase
MTTCHHEERSDVVNSDVRNVGQRRLSFIIAISGRSGSGKTTVAKNLALGLGKKNVSLLPQDAYYKDLGHLPFEDRCLINFDHPESMEMDLFAQHLEELSKGNPINKPVYDYATHTRLVKTEKISPKKFIVSEGILTLTEKKIRSLADCKIFVDTDPDICFIRRLQRDINERDRTVESVIEQYIKTVKPMNDKYVSPGKKYADFVIPEGGFNLPAIEKLCKFIKRKSVQ